jgi:hypothetical protein
VPVSESAGWKGGRAHSASAWMAISRIIVFAIAAFSSTAVAAVKRAYRSRTLSWSSLISWATSRRDMMLVVG